MVLARLLQFHDILVNYDFIYNNYNSSGIVITRNLCTYNSLQYVKLL